MLKQTAWIGLMFWSVFPAHAQDAARGDFNGQPKAPCWEIYAGTSNVAPYTAILLNKCSGDSWLLIRSGVTDKKGKGTDSWVWRWSPLNAESSEAILSPAPGQVVM